MVFGEQVGDLILRHMKGGRDNMARRFSGKLLNAEGEPRQSLLEEGAYSINRRNELTWTLNLAPGKSTELKYEYQLKIQLQQIARTGRLTPGAMPK